MISGHSCVPWAFNSRGEKGVEIELSTNTVLSNQQRTPRTVTSIACHQGEGPAFERAKAACLAALEDLEDHPKAFQARQAFIDAADEAAICVRDK